MRTYSLLMVSAATHDDISNRIRRAGNTGDYDDLFLADGAVAMDGIAIVKEPLNQRRLQLKEKHLLALQGLQKIAAGRGLTSETLREIARGLVAELTSS